jgi:hypothetical protein
MEAIDALKSTDQKKNYSSMRFLISPPWVTHGRHFPFPHGHLLREYEKSKMENRTAFILDCTVE